MTDLGPHSDTPLREKPYVYLAGKISRHGWRERISGHPLDPPGDPLHIDLVGECRDFLITGPFFVYGYHGYAHAPTTHGQGYEDMRSRVFDVSLARIKRSDFVFAHINEVDCFGTLIEIGYAHSCDVPVFLNFGPNMTRPQINEMWFVAHACRCISGNLEAAFVNALNEWRTAVALTSKIGGSRHG